MNLKILKLSLLSVLALSAACRGGDVSPALHNQVVLTKANGQLLTVQVEVADTPELRAKGLMFRDHLPEGTGMLFVFPAETRGAFWMKNTPISLDLIFAKAGAVVAIIENAIPYDETHLLPNSSYTMTLEVPGGYSARNGLAAGDRFEWKTN